MEAYLNLDDVLDVLVLVWLFSCALSVMGILAYLWNRYVTKRKDNVFARLK